MDGSPETWGLFLFPRPALPLCRARRAASVSFVGASVSVLFLWHPFRFPDCMFQPVTSLVSLLAPHTIIFL